MCKSSRAVEAHGGDGRGDRGVGGLEEAVEISQGDTVGSCDPGGGEIDLAEVGLDVALNAGTERVLEGLAVVGVVAGAAAEEGPDGGNHARVEPWAGLRRQDNVNGTTPDTMPDQAVVEGWHTLVIDGRNTNGDYTVVVTLDCQEDDCCCE
jgi:hypothetical protein